MCRISFVGFWLGCRNFTKESPLGKFGTVSVKLTFWMQASGSVLRFVSVLVWVKMYRLGMATDTASLYQPVDFEGRIENLGNFSPEVQSPATASSVRRSLLSNEILGGSIYDPAVYSSHLQFTDEPYFSIEVSSKELWLHWTCWMSCFPFHFFLNHACKIAVMVTESFKRSWSTWNFKCWVWPAAPPFLPTACDSFSWWPLCGCVTSCKPLESIKSLSSSKHSQKKLFGDKQYNSLTQINAAAKIEGSVICWIWSG